MNKRILLSMSLMAVVIIGIVMFIITSASYAIEPREKPQNVAPAKYAESKELLSELSLSQRFNMGYPLLDIQYDKQLTYQNKAWQNFLYTYGTGWRLMWDQRAGRPNLIEGKGIPFYAGKGNRLTPDSTEITLALLDNKIQEFIIKNSDIFRINGFSFKMNTEGSQIFDNGRYCVVQYDYYMKDIPVKEGRIFFRFNNGNLIQFGSLGISDVTISTKPRISQRQAEENVILAFSDEINEVQTFFSSELAIVPEIPAGQDTYLPYQGQEGSGINYRLVWIIRYVKDGDILEFEAWIDALTGKIVSNRSITAFGHVRGNISVVPGDRRWKTFPYCTVTNNGTVNTSMWGYYAYTNSPSTTATAALNGQYFTAVDNCGAISLSTTLSPGNLNFSSSAGTDCDTPGVGGAGNTYSSRSTWWHSNQIRWAADFYLSYAWLGTNVSLDNNGNYDTCNAFWGSGQLWFLRSGGGCNNSGEGGPVVYHEWNHGLDSGDGSPGKIPAGEMTTGESYGDIGAMLIMQDPCIAQGFRVSASCYNCPASCLGVRYVAMRFDHDNNPGTPNVPVTPALITNNNGPDCDRWACPYAGYQGIMGYEGHCESYISSGALWDMIDSMFTARGEEGLTWAMRIWFQSVGSLGSAYQITSGGTCNTAATINGCAATNYYTVILGVDDDNGDLTDGTPNGGRIWNAFGDHGIACGAVPANYNVCSEPATPTLYAVASDGQVGLSWTPSPTATGYRIFYNPFATSTDCTQAGWLPYVTMAGNYNYYTITNMYNTYGYGFAVQALNGSEDCVSGLSNCVFVTPSSTGLVNLMGQKSTSWDYILVPSNDACDSATCNRSAILNGATASTNINFKVRNNSSVDAGAHAHKLFVDDVEELSFARASHLSNTVYELMNYTLWHRGGRSMLKLSIDADNQLAESLETDNEWIAPFAVFAPYDLYTDTDKSLTRTAPPDRDPEGYNYYSVDGYQFSVIPGGGVAYFGVMGLLPGSTSNYDLRLHDDYVGSSQGFGANLQWSQSGGVGAVEFVGINRNVATAPTWWVGLLQGSTTPYTDAYKIHEALSGTTVPVPVTGRAGNIPVVGVTAVEEIYVDATDVASGWRISVTPTGGDIGIALINATAQHFDISDALWNVNLNGSNVAEIYDYIFPATGYYGLVIYKPNSTQSGLSIDYVLDISLAPSNLRPYQAAGWTAPVVPRNAIGCTAIDCLVTATLPGWSGPTYVNSLCTNDGPNPIGTTFQVRYILDDVTDFEIAFAGLNVGSIGTHYNSNTGVIKGGRHTQGLFVDANNTYAENNETDNTYYQQFVWSPLALTDGTPSTTSAPPDRNSTGYFWYNCDGYQFTVVPSGSLYWWGIVGILPFGSTVNYDVRLHDDYTGSQGGFESNLTASNSGGNGAVEIIGVNRNVSGVPTWWAGVIQGTDTPGATNYSAYFDQSGAGIAAPSTGTTGNIPSNGVAAVEEIYVDATDVGVTFTFTVTPSGGDIGIALINQGVQYFVLADALPGTLVNANGSNVAETFNLVPTTAGYYGLLIYKPSSGFISNSINYTIDITVTPSNLRPLNSVGWTAPAVPRNATGCILSSCTVTATLPGWSGTTYVNSTSTNDGPNAVSTTFQIRYLLDDVTLEDVPYSSLPAGNTALDTNNSIAGSLKGGKHTFGLFVDANNNYTESNETDNTHYAQYNWSPMLLADNSPYLSTAPPDRNSTGYFWYNADGYQFSVIPSGSSYYWGAVGLLPQLSTSNYDTRLHNDYTGSTAGFETSVTSSGTGTLGEVEIIGINRNQTPTATWWLGTIQASDIPYTGNYSIHKNVSGLSIAVPSTGTTGTIPTNGVVAVEEIMFDAADVGTTWTITVTPSGGDIAIALIDYTAQYFTLANAIPGTWVNANGPNIAESFTYTPTAAGYYGLLIFKPNYSQLANSINYTLDILAVTSGIAETPDGNLIPGIPLTISKSGASQLLLNWGHSCDQVPGVTHYSIYRGTIASLTTGIYNHTGFMCDSGTDNTETINAELSSYYYLIVPNNLTQEGGYGFNSSAVSRPASTIPCYTQNRIACP